MVLVLAATTQSVKRITLRKFFAGQGSMTPHAAIRPLLGRK
jgi:hypothetical protein